MSLSDSNFEYGPPGSHAWRISVLQSPLNQTTQQGREVCSAKHPFRCQSYIR